jgi:hypothetical protein
MVLPGPTPIYPDNYSIAYLVYVVNKIGKKKARFNGQYHAQDSRLTFQLLSPSQLIPPPFQFFIPAFRRLQPAFCLFVSPGRPGIRQHGKTQKQHKQYD